MQSGCRMRITWLASYPRSGNTWLRFLLFNYFWGVPTHSSQVALRIPDLHKPRRELAPALDLARQENAVHLFIKTHHPLSKSHPMIEQTGGFIYLIRHPKDVLLSLMNYHGVQPADAPAYARQFIDTGSDPFMPHFGTWDQHAASWLGSRPKLLLRYDHMRADPTGAMEAVLEFLGESSSPERVARAVAASTFDAMRKMEELEAAVDRDSGLFNLGVHASNAQKFVHRGTIAGSLQELSPELDRLLEQRFGPTIERLLPPADAPPVAPGSK